MNNDSIPSTNELMKERMQYFETMYYELKQKYDKLTEDNTKLKNHIQQQDEEINALEDKIYEIRHYG